MKRNITLNENDFTIKQEGINAEVAPKQSTIDFLKNYARVVHVVRLSEQETATFILN